MNAEFREARPEDAATVLAFMCEFNASQAYAFDERRARRALEELLTSPDLGRIWLIVTRGSAVGYVVLTLGFSLEYGGRDAFIDEFYVQPQARGQGFGKAALSFALHRASCLGVRAVHLEVESGNASAHSLYQSLGFGGNHRRLLTKRVAG